MKIISFIFFFLLVLSSLKSQSIGFYGGLNINQLYKISTSVSTDYLIGFGHHFGLGVTLPKKHRKHETFLLYFSHDFYQGIEKNRSRGAYASRTIQVERQIISLTPYFLNLKRENFNLYAGPEISYVFNGKSTYKSEVKNSLRVAVNLRFSYSFLITENLRIEPMYIFSWGITIEQYGYLWNPRQILHRIGIGIIKEFK
jgi:hypothetical protein